MSDDPDDAGSDDHEETDDRRSHCSVL